MEKALSPHSRKCSCFKASWCFHFKGKFSLERWGECSFELQIKDLGTYPGTRNDFYMQRERARSEACVQYTSTARLGSIGCSTICGHQMEEETCKWTVILGFHSCVVSHAWEQLVPPGPLWSWKIASSRSSAQHWGLPKCTTEPGPYSPHKHSLCKEQLLEALREGRHYPRIPPIVHSLTSNTQG